MIKIDSLSFNKAKQILSGFRENSKLENDHKINEINKAYPEIEKIREELKQTSIKLSKIIISKKSDSKQSLNKLMDENLKAQKKIKDILEKNGYDKDYLEIKHKCKKCSDAGFINGKKCECLLKLIKNIEIKELNKASVLALCDFSNFSLDYYPENCEKTPKINCKKHMEAVLNYCKNYAKKFSLNSKSIFMQGNTGIGKTHLSLSIAKEVISKGFNVVYGSTQDLLREIEKEHFGKEKTEKDTLKVLLSTDLLVLDDLGAEFSSQFNISVIHNIINSRMNMGKPTIISSNLETNELVAKYSDRVASRILTFDILGFFGNDIREIKRVKKM